MFYFFQGHIGSVLEVNLAGRGCVNLYLCNKSIHPDRRTDPCIEVAHCLKEDSPSYISCPTANPNTNGPTLVVIGRYY